MEYRETAAPAPLERHVQCLWRLRDPTPSGAPQTIYPDGRCELIVHLAQPMQIQTPTGWRAQGRCLFAAQARSAIRLRATGSLDCVGVRLRPEASAALFSTELRDTTALAGVADQVLDLRALDEPFALALIESLGDGADPLAPAFVRLLSERLSTGSVDAQVSAAVAALDRAHGNLGVRALATTLGISVRSLQSRFLAAVGLTVKEYALVQRLQATIRQLDGGAAALAETAIEMGFADQAHATRALRAFAGMTPARLRSALAAQRDGDQTLAMAAAFVRGESLPSGAWIAAFKPSGNEGGPPMAQQAQVRGKVEYRQGDGVTATIRPGPVEVQTTPTDATLSWSEGETHGSAAIPLQDFRNYVSQGAIDYIKAD